MHGRRKAEEMAQGSEKDTPALSETTVTKCITIHTFEPESQPSSPRKWVNCFSLASSTQEALNTKSDLESANLSHILLHIDIPNQHLYPLPMLITPVHCIYLVTFDLRYQKESLSKVHSVMKNVYTLTSYCSEAGGRKQLPEVLLVGMHAGEVVAEDRSRFTQKLNEMLKKMPYNRLVEKPGGDEPFWAVDGGNLSLSGTDPLSEHIKICGCSHQVEVHKWIMHHCELEEKLQNVPCICYNDLKSELACISSDDHILKNCLQFLHNYGFIFDHSIKVEEEAEEGKEGQVANKGKEGQEREKVVLLQPQCLCDLFAKVPEFSKGKELFTITDLFTRPAAYTKVGVTNKQWFQRICIDMGLVVELRSDYVFLMALKGGSPGSPPHDEYSVPPLLVTFKDSNHFVAEPEYLLPSYFFAAFATKFLGALAHMPPERNQPEVKVMEQHYMQVKKGTTVIHVVEQDSCLEIGLQQLDVCKKLTDEKKMRNLHTFCLKIKSAVVKSAESILGRMKLAPSSIRYGLYHSRDTEDGPLDSFAAYIPDDQEGPYLECSCCDDGVQPTTPLQDIWFLEDFTLAKVTLEAFTTSNHHKIRKLHEVTPEETPSSSDQTDGQSNIPNKPSPPSGPHGTTPQPKPMESDLPERTQTPLVVEAPLTFDTVTGRPDYLVLLRKHVSRKAAGKGRAVLEGVWLDAPTIETCFRDNPLDEEAAVQAGLTKWVGGKGRQPPTWEVLLAAMDVAEVAQQDIQDLRTALSHPISNG